ncbi:MAG TPA: GNAT family N-acetyltransferase [Acidimicrobiales bacterium]|nr:GNAT family N-acetyltransferase [Acidimicrobiales bacterium]
MTELRWMDGGAGGLCARLLETVPLWFGMPEANAAYAETADRERNVVAFDGDDAVGILTVVQHSPEAAEVHLMAVRIDLHRRGVGRQMLGAAEANLRAEGFRFLQVKTLSSKSADESYAKTRAFYAAMGFVVLEEMPELWDPSNPAVIMIKAL